MARTPDYATWAAACWLGIPLDVAFKVADEQEAAKSVRVEEELDFPDIHRHDDHEQGPEDGIGSGLSERSEER